MIYFDVFKFTLIFNRMDVAAYIKELLYSGQLVYVPGLGTFSKRKTSVVYNEGQQSFYPPKNSIDFVEEEKQDDKLENYISKQKNISATAANYFIEKFVGQLKNDALNKNLPVKEVLFPAENETSAENKKADTVFNEENFGLPPVRISALKKIPGFAEKEAATKENDAENFYTAFSVNALEEKEESKPKRSTGFWASVFLLLLICLLGIYALYLYYPDLFSRFNQDNPSVVITPKPVDTVNKLPVIAENQPEKDTAKAKIVTDTPAALVEKAVTKPAAKIPAVVETADPDLVEKSPYEIIGAAFKTLTGAKTFLKQLKAKGMHRAKILNNTHGKATLITFGSFEDKQTAQAELERLRAKDVHSEAYIQHYIK